VNIDETGREDCAGGIFGEIEYLRVARDFTLRTGRYLGDAAVFYEEKRVEYLFLRRVEAISAEDDHNRIIPGKIIPQEAQRGIKATSGPKSRYAAEKSLGPGENAGLREDAPEEVRSKQK